MVKQKRVPLRTCVVCRSTDVKKSLIRIVRQKAADGAVSVLVDRSGKANGRGAYVCNSAECVEKALRQKRFEKSLNIASVSEEFAAQLRAAVDPVEAPAPAAGG